jgi:hypothetical protein
VPGAAEPGSLNGNHQLVCRGAAPPGGFPELDPLPRTQLHPVDKIGLVNDLAHDRGPFGPDYNVVEDPVAGSFGVVADDVELDEPGVPESVNEFTWS